MKKLFFLMFLLGSVLVSFASSVSDTIQVKVAVVAAKNTFTVKKELKAKAKKESVKKYILKLNSETPETIIEKACAEYDLFVLDLEPISEDWEQIDNSSGQLLGEYVAELDLEKINQWLSVNGFKHQSKIELIIMEEPPSLAQIKMNSLLGTGVNESQFFIQNYTTYQRRLRDSIIKKVDTFGFDVKLLEDNDMYKSYKSKDSTLLGVYFDPETNDFTINRELLDAVKANNPDTLVLYFRIDSLIFEPSTQRIRTTVAFNLKDLNANVTKSIGAGSYQIVSRGTTQSMVIDDLALCAENAMNSLMNSEDLGGKLNDFAMSLKNAANVPTGPLTLVVNAAAFESKIRKRAMFMIKKELLAKGLTTDDKVKSSNITLSAEIVNPEVTAADELYFNYIDPILTELGIELDDEKVFYNKNSLTIKP